MKRFKVLMRIFILIVLFYFSKNLVIGQTQSVGLLSASSSVPIVDSYAINISGGVLSSTNALNVTVNFTPGGSAQLDSGTTLKATGATQLLSDVNPGTGLVTVVWTGGIADGKATITGKLKAGSVFGNPKINVVKIEAAGGLDITNTVVVNALLLSSTVVEPTPTPSPSPTPTPTPKPTSPSDAQGPKLSLSGPDSISLKPKAYLVRVVATGLNFTSITKCQAISSDKSFLIVRPKLFLLSPTRNKKTLFVTVRPNQSLGVADSEIVNISASCTNDTEDDFDILLTPPGG